MTKKEWLDYFNNPHKNTDLKLVDEFARVNNINLKHREVLPAFFTGDILKKNKILLFSINPRFTEIETQIEQEIQNINFDDIQELDYTNWFNTCINRFEFYRTQNKGMHKIFYNFYKLINPNEMRNKSSNSEIALKFMQDNVVNVDWIPYYSGSIDSVNFHNNKNKRFESLVRSWNNSIEKVIEETKPKFIFIHGGKNKFKKFLELNTDINLNQPIFDMQAYGNPPVCSVYRGNKIFNQDIQVIFVSNFINNFYSDKNAEIIYNYLKSENLVG